ncbi:uncharacterized protein LOC142358269 [Convolutriloba macropyga]|uniref:uncharacterized protein LOC142358269 n=1 Tax=Convolutriloba macropyga TaxID=536237 RepID=UPI003F527268
MVSLQDRPVPEFDDGRRMLTDAERQLGAAGKEFITFDMSELMTSKSCGSSPSFAVCNNFLCLDSDDENRESDGDDDDSTSLLWKSLAPDTPSPGPSRASLNYSVGSDDSACDSWDGEQQVSETNTAVISTDFPCQFDNPLYDDKELLGVTSNTEEGAAARGRMHFNCLYFGLESDGGVVGGKRDVVAVLSSARGEHAEVSEEKQPRLARKPFLRRAVVVAGSVAGAAIVSCAAAILGGGSRRQAKLDDSRPALATGQKSAGGQAAPAEPNPPDLIKSRRLGLS